MKKIILAAAALILSAGMISAQDMAQATETFNNGATALGAGDNVRLNFAGDRLVSLNVSASQIDTLIENHQAISAAGGAILLTAAAAEGRCRRPRGAAGGAARG